LILLGISAYRIQSYFERRRQEAFPLSAVPVSSISVAPGFRLDLVYSAQAGEGSWASMTVDPQGRFIVSPEEVSPLQRLTVENGKFAKIEAINQPVTAAMGLLYAQGSLYLDCQGPEGRGLYRMIDNNGAFGAPKLLLPLDMSMFEHGAHAIALGPDKKLYVVCGDYTAPPTDLSPASPFRRFGDDQLLPRDEDPQGIGVGLPPSTGFVLRMDLDGNNCELFAGGTRNTYDIAFNADGELFGFDADAEYDFGLPWYRPIRVNHWISGADFGYREGTGKFPEYYEDTLPATLNVGIGSPTGVKFAPANCTFPPFYQNACFMEDWAYGRLFAVHFTPSGASYRATIETILHGSPLNMTALSFGADGALYFTTGGHVSESGLYRLTWAGGNLPALLKTPHELVGEKKAAEDRNIRRKLESFDGRPAAGAVDLIWPQLKSEDRWMRYAARVALESQDAGLWRERALTESNIFGGLTALLALARCGPQETQPELLSALDKFPFAGLTQEQTLLRLRVTELSFIRQGHPGSLMAKRIIDSLDPMYPSPSQNVNRELCQLLLYLDAPGAVGKTLELLRKAPTQEEQIYYVMRLRNITNGWTLAQRKEYFSWFLKDHEHAAHPLELLRSFKEISREYWNGNRLVAYLENFRQEAAASLSAEDRRLLASYLPPKPQPVASLVSTTPFVKNWKYSDLAPHLRRATKQRNIARGRNLFVRAQCVLCHRFGSEGGSFGPDLTAVGSRMTSSEILESILEPSKVVVQQYQNTLSTMKDGDVVLGRIIGDDADKVTMLVDGPTMNRKVVLKSNIRSRAASKISPMPEGLLNSMTESDIWDLVVALKTGIHSAAQP
jgi:putative heme-binding domain-containing protein